LPQKSDFIGIKSIVAIKRTTETKHSKTETTEYYISNLPGNPENLLKSVREHWKIESMHWMLDVIWGEDDTDIISVNSNKTLNALRKFALFAHKKYISERKLKCTIRKQVFECMLDDNKLFDVAKFL
jgi:predicted transposase YbfD/YdcC